MIRISFTNNIIVHISDHFFRDRCTFLHMVKLLSKKLTYSFFLNFHFIDLLLKSKHCPTSAPSTAAHDNFPQGPEPCQFHIYGSSWKASQDGISAVSRGCWSQRKVWDAQMPPGNPAASQTTSWLSCNKKPGAFTQTGITEIGGGGRMAEMKKDFYQRVSSVRFGTRFPVKEKQRYSDAVHDKV